MATLKDIVKSRRSFRTFDGNLICPEDREKLEEYINAGITNPFGIPVEFVLLDAEEYGLSSPVIAGEKLYVAGKITKVPYADVAFGYSFERLVLFAWSLGIGTTWIGGTMKREQFEKAAGLKDGETMPCVSPLGYPAKKLSLREVLMRKGVKADSRLAFGELFFEGSFDRPLTEGAAGKLAPALEAVRLAPSAVNKQPWRAVVCGERVHFYEKRSRGYVSDNGWDMQKIDMGIALCHFELAAKECGVDAAFELGDPSLPVPEGVTYIASFVLR